MTKEELLIPRWRIIADYPNSIFQIGDIFEESMLDFLAKPVGSFPSIFQKLEWWEYRSHMDLPEYIRRLGDGKIYKVIDYYRSHDSRFIDLVAVSYYASTRDDVTEAINLFEPATEDDFNTVSTQ